VLLAATRHPRALQYRIVKDGTLDDNSAYAYVAFTTHFADSCLVAEDAASTETLGFVMGYREPHAPDTLFVWQIGVGEQARGKRIGNRMLKHLATQMEGVKYVEATVTPGNAASRALFTGFARDVGAPVSVVEDYFPKALFPEGHEEEGLFRIGPFELERR
jgi:L-2,4-diaminobutyric acid acetyltransferase